MEENPKKFVYEFACKGSSSESEQYSSSSKAENYFDFQPIDLDYQALAGAKQEPYSTYKFREEHTLCIIKPGAMVHKNEIMRRLYEEGFTVLKTRTVWLSAEQLSELYVEHYGKPWFPKFIVKMSRGPVCAVVLAKDNAVADLRLLAGPPKVSQARREAPHSLRALFGARGDRATNAVHASQSVEKAKNEIRFFFPQTAMIEPLAEVKETLSFVQEKFIGTVLRGLVELNSAKPTDPMAWLSEWLLKVRSASPELREGTIILPQTVIDKAPSQGGPC